MHRKNRRAVAQEDTIKPIIELSQRFMRNRRLLEFMAEAACISREDVVLEIGGGTGALTYEILQHNPRNLIVIEKDARLYMLLKQKFAEYNNIKIILGDILEYKPPQDLTKIISNPPYHIISRLLTRMLGWNFKIAVLTLQKEVGHRLVSEPGTKEYGRLTVLYKLGHEVEILKTVPPSCFYPKPRVSSVIVRIKKTDRSSLDYEGFSSFLRSIFSHRRKKLKNSLRSIGLRKQEVEQLIERIDEDKLCKRADELEATELLEVYKAYKAVKMETA